MSITVKIAEMLVNITASAGGFIKPTKEARKELHGFRKDVKASQAVLSGFRSTIALVGGGLSFAGAIASARSYMNELDSLGKVAAKLKVDTRDLSALRFGAEQSGLGDGVIDKALQKLSQRISEAKSGVGEAVPVFKELGLSLSSLSGMSADRQLDAIADALQGVSNQGDKIRLATKLFEEEGVGLLNMLSNGSQGLREFRDEAKAMGISFGTDAVAGVEKANDAINRLKTTMGAIGQTIVIEMGPGVESVANKIAKGLQEFREGVRLAKDSGKKTSPGFLDRQFPWTKSLVGGLIDAERKHIAKQTDQLVRAQMAAGIAMESGPNGDPHRRPNGTLFTQAEIDRNREARLKNEAMANGVVYLKDRGVDIFNQAKVWAQGDGLKALSAAAKQVEDTQKTIRDWIRGAAIESLIRPPGWKAERERNAEARRAREEQRSKLLEQSQAQGSTGLNSAIEANTAEAFRVIAENKVQREQLNVAREAQKLLASIDRGIEKISITAVGL